MSAILTIDFDIIMSPSIQLYNDLIGDQKSVNKIIKQYPLLEYTMTADFFIYEAITRELVKLFKRLPAEKVYFIKEHQTLLQLVKDIDKFQLFNVDHHHDIGYNKTKAATKIIKPECGNWVKYLGDKGKLNEYIWICNDNSDMPASDLHKIYLTEPINVKEFNFDSVQDIDKLIICNSPQWIPANIQALFMAWLGIAEEFYDKSFNLI